MPRSSCLLLVSALVLVVASTAPPPPNHIVMIIIDDCGFADMSYKAATYANQSEGFPLFPTPTLDSMALQGVRMESYYVHALCSPSRTALLSGRYAYNIGMNAEVITNGVPDQLPTNIKTVADILSAGGWATSAYGKYDAGMTVWGDTPGCRGFQTWAGFYNADNDYFTHVVSGGLDLRVNFLPDLANSSENGFYMTHLITARVQEWVASISNITDRRTFAYVAHQAIHAPQQVPASYLEGFCTDQIPSDQPTRQLACGQMRAVDESVAMIRAAYEEAGILNDTLFIVSTDNGGNQDTGGNNWPLRGVKASTFEGGIRGLAFVSGAGLSPSVAGSISQEFYSLVDWLPTIIEGIAGLNLSAAVEARYPYQPPPPALDGMNIWESLSQGLPSPRTEALLYLDPFSCFSSSVQDVPCDIPGQGAYRRGQWKLIHGHVSAYAGPNNCTSAFCGGRDGNFAPNTFPLNVTAATTPPFCPTGWVPPPGSGLPAVVPPPDLNSTVCRETPCMIWGSPYLSGGTWLFDVVNDPFETTDLAAQYPDIVAELLAALDAYNATNIPQAHSAQDPAAAPSNFHGIWTPWRGNPDPTVCDPNVTNASSALHSNFDGPIFNTTETGEVTLALQGWAWDGDAADGGRAPLEAFFQVDGAPIGSAIANISRPGLIPKTGAPNAEHGFSFVVDPPLALNSSIGQHMFAAFVKNAAGNTIAVQNSPLCYCYKKPCKCRPVD